VIGRPHVLQKEGVGAVVLTVPAVTTVPICRVGVWVVMRRLFRLVRGCGLCLVQRRSGLWNSPPSRYPASAPSSSLTRSGLKLESAMVLPDHSATGFADSEAM
jgi:hypothetical protein